MRVVIATEQPESGDASDSMSVMEGQNKEDFPDYPVDLSKDDKEKSEVVEAAEGKDECGSTWKVSSEEEQTPLSSSLLDLSLKRSTAGICESRPHASEDNSGIKANLKKTVQGHKFAEKRKMTDSSEVLLKRPAESPQMRSGVRGE